MLHRSGSLPRHRDPRGKDRRTTRLAIDRPATGDGKLGKPLLGAGEAELQVYIKGGLGTPQKPRTWDRRRDIVFIHLPSPPLSREFPGYCQRWPRHRPRNRCPEILFERLFLGPPCLVVGDPNCILDRLSTCGRILSIILDKPFGEELRLSLQGRHHLTASGSFAKLRLYQVH